MSQQKDQTELDELSEFVEATEQPYEPPKKKPLCLYRRVVDNMIDVTFCYEPDIPMSAIYMGYAKNCKDMKEYWSPEYMARMHIEGQKK